MIHPDLAFLDVLDDARLGQRVEIPAQQQLHVQRVDVRRRVSGAEGGRRVLGDALQLLHQHHGLNELDVAELRIPVDVGGGDDERKGGIPVCGHSVVPTGLLRLEHCGQGDVVLGHHPVEHDVAAFGVGHGHLIELDGVLLDHLEFGLSPEYGAAVDVLAFGLAHGFGPRFGREDAVVAVPLEFGQEEVVELVRLHLLQGDDVRRVMPDLVEDALFAVLPVEGPLRAIRVLLSSGVPVAQHVVTHHGEQNRGFTPLRGAQLHPRAGRRGTRRH